MWVTFSAVASRMMGIVAAVSRADRYDLVVIGGGSAGLTAGGLAARIGARVLIAATQLGGDCTWTGCIPSKALIRAARQAYEGRRAAAMETGTRGIEVTIGEVRFLDRETVQARERKVRGGHFVLCTGAAPFIPPITGLEIVRYLTYETVFDLERQPKSMIVIGAGATGLEIAQALARLGTRVTLVDQRDAVLADADPDASAIIQRRLQSEGVTIELSTEVDRVATEDGQVVVRAGASQLKADTLLVAAGRRPRIGSLSLELAGVEVRDGSIRVNKHLRTTNPLVYAAGDVTGGFQFTHYAGWQGYIAARNALLPGAQHGVRSNIPWAVFSDPEIAQAGLSEAEARTLFTDVKVHRLDLEGVDRAQTEDERDGFLKLITHSGGKLIGAVVVSRVAGEIINELALTIDRGLSVSDLASTIHAYPTFGFAIQQLAAEAALDAAATGIRGKAVHALRRLS